LTTCVEQNQSFEVVKQPRVVVFKTNQNS